MNPFILIAVGSILVISAIFGKKETEEEKAEKERLKLQREQELKTPIPTKRTVRDLQIEYKILENKKETDRRPGKEEEYQLRMERILGKIEYAKNNNAYKVQHP